jgi:hypothetical protein
MPSQVGPSSDGSSVVTVFSKSITLTNAQIKTLPTVPQVIVPATEVLNYSGLPTRLPLPLFFSVTLNSLAGAYTNVGAAAYYVLAIGSDWSLDGLQADQNLMINLASAVRGIGAANSFHEVLNSGFIAPLTMTNGSLQDNALAIALSTDNGNLTGGNVANSMKVTVLYTIIDV